MSVDTILTVLRSYLKLPPDHSIVIEPLQKGGSGRAFFRLKPANKSSYIGVSYSLDRSENAKFVDIAGFLKSINWQVPEIYYHDPLRQTIVMSDLGGCDLLSLKDEKWQIREPIYRDIFRQIDLLYYKIIPKDVAFEDSFDTAMYQWEQQYFFSHFVEDYLQVSKHEIATILQHPYWLELATKLTKHSNSLIHRDLQSENIIIQQNKAYLIDFQGMRKGCQAYDLASLIYDPYINHSAEDKQKLLDLWEDITEELPVMDIYYGCAIQRLMQAIGAYARFTKEGKTNYQQYLPIAAKSLYYLIQDLPIFEQVAPYLERVIKS